MEKGWVSMKRRLLILSGILFSSLALARTDMTDYGDEKTREAAQAAQQGVDIVNKQMQILKDLMNNPATKKMFQQAGKRMKGQGTNVDFEKMARDFFGGKTPQVPEVGERGKTFQHAVLDEVDFLARAYIRYGVERHEISHAKDGSNRSVLTDSSIHLDLVRFFTGKFQKVYDLNRKHPDQFHFHIKTIKGEKPEMAKADYALDLQITPDGGKSHCRDEEINYEDGSLSANPLGEDSSKAERYFFNINAGVRMESPKCHAYPVPHWKTDVILSRADLDTLFKEGRLQKVFRQIHPIDFESGMIHEKWWAQVPSDTLLFFDPRSGNKYRNVEVTLEMMLGPAIEGPHYLALPKQTIDLIENEISLEVKPIPGWKIGPIKPVGGWKGGSDVVKEMRKTATSLTLAPLNPGRRQFEVEWTNPKGKAGKSEPFEVTVVLLEFDKEKKCDGFDDVEAIPAPAVSMCQGREKWIRLKSQPAIIDVETELLAGDVKGFHVSPDKFSGFSGDPKRIALLGKSQKSYSMLTARIKIDEDHYQTAAQIYADSMEDRTIKILPIFLDSDPQALSPPDIAGMFNQAKHDLQQTCVTLDVLPMETIKPKDVPAFTGGDTVRYDLQNGDPLVDYSRKPSHYRGQELTVFVVPFIAQAIQDEKGSPTEELDANPLGFQYADVVFISQASFSQYPHVMGHEIGHYIFKDMYVSLEGAAHTPYNDMLMYHTSTEDCEIRQEEWRQVVRY